MRFLTLVQPLAKLGKLAKRGRKTTTAHEDWLPGACPFRRHPTCQCHIFSSKVLLLTVMVISASGTTVPNGETFALMCDCKSPREAFDVENAKARPSSPGFFLLAGVLSGDVDTRLHRKFTTVVAAARRDALSGPYLGLDHRDERESGEAGIDGAAEIPPFG